MNESELSKSFEEMPIPEETGRPRARRLAEVLAEARTEPDWIIRNLLPAGGLGIIGADYSEGKSTLVAQLSACVASGTPFLGYPVDRPGAVLYWQAEGNQRLFAERIRVMCEKAEIDWEELELLFPPAYWLQPFKAPEFEEFVRESGAKLVVADTVGFFHSASENDATEWKEEVIKPLKAIARKYGVAFLFVHHFGKPSETRTGRHRIRGTSAMGGDCDTVICLDPMTGDRERRILRIEKVKDAPEQPALRLRFHADKAFFELEGPANGDDSAPNDRYDRALAAAKDGIRVALRRAPEGLSGRALFAETGGNKSKHEEARSQMRKAFEIFPEHGPRNSSIWKLSRTGSVVGLAAVAQQPGSVTGCDPVGGDQSDASAVSVTRAALSKARSHGHADCGTNSEEVIP